MGLLALAGPAAALEGNPPVTVLTPNIEAPPQNADIAQDGSAVLFVANGGGVLNFDGERWRITPLPTGDIATSLAYDGGPRVYVGGYGVLGYLERDATGAEVFHDLTPLFAPLLGGERFAQVWYVRVTADGVFFVSTSHAFFYQPRTQAVRIWRHPGRFGAIATGGGTTVLQFRGEGLRRFAGGDWQPIPGTAPMADLLDALVRLPDGGWLGASTNGRWLEWHNGAARERPMPPGFPAASQFDAGCVLDDGSLVFANVDGTLWLLDPSTNLARSIHLTRGVINAVMPAQDGGLFAVTDLGVFHLDRPGGWSIIGSDQGIVGEIHNIRSWNGRWLALTDSGAYAQTGASTAFQRLPWTDNDAFDLIALDANHALLAEFYRLETIDQRGAHVFGDHDLYPRLLLQSRFDPDTVYVGTEFGLAVLRRQGQGWQLLMDRGKDENSITSLVELGPGDLLLGSLRHGAHRIRLAPDQTQVAEDRTLAQADGISYGKVARTTLSADDGGVLAATGAGLFRWTGDRFEPTALDGLDPKAALPASLRFATAPGGDRWAYGDDRIYRRLPGQRWKAEDVATIVSGFIQSIAFDGSDGTLFGCANAILRHRTAQSEPVPPAQMLMLRTVEFKRPESETRTPLPLRPDAPPRVPPDAIITLSYALPDFRGQHAARYQWRMQGTTEQYSDWEALTTHTFSHMHAGEFVFQGRARDSLGRISAMPDYRLVILPPWYAAGWAQTLWATLLLISLGGLTYGVISWRTRQLRATQARLEGVIAERTHELRTVNQRLFESAHHDILTGRPNRALFEIRLEQARVTAERHQGRFAVLFIDLDQFKTINDSLGHEAGDRLLKDMAGRLSASLRREDTLARWGGDEFAALVENLHSTDDAAVVAQALLEAASAPFELVEGHPAAALSTSIGISLYPDDTITVAELIRNADTAMYTAKNRGGNQSCFYSSSMTEQARTRLIVRNGLRLALERQEFVLHYQPLVDVASGRIVGAEALLRWRQPSGELADPAGFIPIAESSGLIPGIGSWVLATACRQGHPWIERDPGFRLAINVSPRQLRDLDLVAAVDLALKESGTPANQLILEVTESSIAEAGEDADRVIGQLKALGVHIAVDDFGTGLSSLASLKRYQFDSLKIDRSFVRDIPQDHADMEIAATIVAMGHSLGLSVTAEGVETAEQLEFLRSCGCDLYQGFLLSPGVGVDEFAELLRRNGAAH